MSLSILFSCATGLKKKTFLNSGINELFFFILSNMLSLPVNTLAFGDMTELMAYLLSACVCVRMCVNCAPLKF